MTPPGGNLLRKIKLEIAINDNYVDSTVKAIMEASRSGETGDGKIFVLNLENCIRIRTAEKGPQAIG